MCDERTTKPKPSLSCLVRTTSVARASTAELMMVDWELLLCVGDEDSAREMESLLGQPLACTKEPFSHKEQNTTASEINAYFHVCINIEKHTERPNALLFNTLKCNEDILCWQTLKTHPCYYTLYHCMVSIAIATHTGYPQCGQTLLNVIIISIVFCNLYLWVKHDLRDN